MSDTPKEGPSPDQVEAPSDVDPSATAPEEGPNPDEVEAPSEVEASATAPEAGAEGRPPRPEDPASPLARPIQEHLAQQLRTTYHVMADKPAFLGDPVVPPQFDQHIQRLEIREKAHDKGIQAVKAALRDLGVDVVEADDLGSVPRKG